jgi:hypothetical protein
MYDLKPLSKDAIPAALGRAERYRLLNEPSEAESICLDVLQVDPDHQQALVILILALTDQFGDPAVSGAALRAQDLLKRLASEYERAYYAGIICERRAKAHLSMAQPGVARVARDWLLEALRFFEQAETRRPQGNDDAILRWNACARILMRNPHLQAVVEERTEPLLLE